MREILFKGKSKETGLWITGDLSHHKDGRRFIRFWYTGTYTSIEVEPETVCQYTGLTDMHREKIFEGDILKLTQVCGDEATVWIAAVEFGNPNSFYSWGWQLRHVSGETGFNKDILLWCDMEETGATCEIVGNIHDGLHPALEAGNGNPANHT